VSSQPLDEDRVPPIIHGDYEPTSVAFNVEDHSIRANNVCMGITGLDISRVLPLCLPRFMEPGIERSIQRTMVFAALQAVEEPFQCASCYDAHKSTVSCSQNGHNIALRSFG